MAVLTGSLSLLLMQMPVHVHNDNNNNIQHLYSAHIQNKNFAPGRFT
jgi:hypothetical protein